MIFQEELRDTLLGMCPDAKVVSGGKEVLMRCRFCGDSIDPKKKHLYVGLGYDANKPPMYNCFKCGESGILRPAILQEFGIYDIAVLQDLNSFMAKNAKKYPKLLNGQKVYSLNNTFIRNAPESFDKLNYINDRLGTNLSFKNMIEDKIVLNIGDLISENRITEFTRDRSAIMDIDRNAIGFISEDNNMINSRFIDSKHGDLRYLKYKIHDDLDSSGRYYTLPASIILTDPNPIEVHAAEGPFDILSIRHNVVKDSRQKIFTAIGNKAYRNIMRHIITDYGMINLIYHMYIDNDLSDREISNVLSYLRPLNIPVVLHHNAYPGEKDFGVHKDRIVDEILGVR